MRIDRCGIVRLILQPSSITINVGCVAIITFAEFKDLSPSRILEVDLAYKCGLMICS